MRILVITILTIASLNFSFGQKSAIRRYGQLSVQGRALVAENGDTVQLRGMSLFWSQWMGKYFKASTINWLVEDWKVDVVRAAMGVEHGGYLENPAFEEAKVDSVVMACIQQNIYVIIDFHAHKAHLEPEKALTFFASMAKKYGDYPNVIYETFNEPEGNLDWEYVLKPYHQAIIDTIRHYDPDNIIICGSANWCQRLNQPSDSPLKGKNIMYSLHYYAHSHQDNLRNVLIKAADGGLPVFVSEFGNCHYSGDGGFDTVQARIWWDLLDKYKISWCKWSISDKDEVASALKPGTSPDGGWMMEQLTESGAHVRNEIRTKNLAKIKAEKALEKLRKQKAKEEKKKKKEEKGKKKG